MGALAAPTSPLLNSSLLVMKVLGLDGLRINLFPVSSLESGKLDYDKSM